jgi:hypothetical protein
VTQGPERKKREPAGSYPSHPFLIEQQPGGFRSCLTSSPAGTKRVNISHHHHHHHPFSRSSPSASRIPSSAAQRSAAQVSPAPPSPLPSALPPHRADPGLAPPCSSRSGDHVVPQRYQIGSGEAVPDLRLFDAGPAICSAAATGSRVSPAHFLPDRIPIWGSSCPGPEPADLVCSRAGGDPSLRF